MPGHETIGKLLVFIGVFIAVMGLLIVFRDRIPMLMNLPGDIHFEKDGWRVVFPITSCLIISILLTMVLNLIARFLGR